MSIVQCVAQFADTFYQERCDTNEENLAAFIVLCHDASKERRLSSAAAAPISIPCDSFFTTFRYRHHKKAMARRQMVFYVFLLPIQLVK